MNLGYPFYPIGKSYTSIFGRIDKSSLTICPCRLHLRLQREPGSYGSLPQENSVCLIAFYLCFSTLYPQNCSAWEKPWKKTPPNTFVKSSEWLPIWTPPLTVTEYWIYSSRMCSQSRQQSSSKGVEHFPSKQKRASSCRGQKSVSSLCGNKDSAKLEMLFWKVCWFYSPLRL